MTSADGPPSGTASDSVIVVGAGIVGIACAHYLSRAGWRVTVIDQGNVAGACSHANCGYICPSHVLPLTEPGAIGMAFWSLFNPRAPFRVKPRFDPSLWHWMWQFARRCSHRQMLEAGTHLKALLDASMNEYRQLVSAEAFDCEWKDNGLLYVLRTQRGWHRFAETDQLLTDHFGVKARRIDGADLPEFCPGLKPGLAGAFHYAGDASVRPDRLNAQWAGRLAERGVCFVENCRLTGIRRKSRRVTSLETSEGPLTADAVVIATGSWSSRWAKSLDCRIPVQPGKGYSVTLPPVEPAPRYPMLFPEHKVGVSPFAGGLRLGSMMEFAGFDSSIPHQRIQQLRDSASPYLAASLDGQARETWYGWRPMTWDSLPVIGRVPNIENAFLATGHNMLGLTLAPATGRLVAELMTGDPVLVDPAPYSPERF